MTAPASRTGRPRMPILGWSLILLAASYVLLRFGVQPPIPSSVLAMYVFFLVVAQLLYVSSDAQRLREFVRPLVDLIVAPAQRPLRLVVGLVLPLLSGFYAYVSARTEVGPPAQQRTIHPAPPSRIEFGGRSIDLLTAENPLRELENQHPEQFREHVENGRRVYYENCVFCHGDSLEGDGLFAHGLSPLPANLADAGTIAQLQESYVFWRVAKGGPGLPVEATPWDSAMPAWEKFLTEGEIWEVILFLYDFTGARPRAWE